MSILLSLNSPFPRFFYKPSDAWQPATSWIGNKALWVTSSSGELHATAPRTLPARRPDYNRKFCGNLGSAPSIGKLACQSNLSQRPVATRLRAQVCGQTSAFPRGQLPIAACLLRCAFVGPSLQLAPSPSREMKDPNRVTWMLVATNSTQRHTTAICRPAARLAESEQCHRCGRARSALMDCCPVDGDLVLQVVPTMSFKGHPCCVAKRLVVVPRLPCANHRAYSSRE